MTPQYPMELRLPIFGSGFTRDFMEILKPMAVHPHLIVLYPQSEFAELPLELGTVVLGRGQDADIRFEDELVSRRHCALTFDGQSVTVEDLGSTNGTFVDGNYINKQILDSDNRLQIGKIVLKIAYKDSNEEAFSRELYEAATLDELTGLLNHQTFMDRSAGELVSARRGGAFVHVAMIRVDGFKQLTETNGEMCGDLILKEVARLLNDEKRDSDLLARNKGEKFMLLMNGISPEDAKKRAEKMRLVIERHIFSWMDSRIPVTISIGLVSRQGAEVTQMNELIAESDGLLNTAP
ncbi:GGDEF/FHA domain protein [Fibrobacter succinogenes subsp. succinogenes S85]|uniref:diguanylate cyclase n=2 Tax=Fibrobacter succinogenes (strain ATCC 19169 / S85) TaxID=59374 RepID=D9S5D8_FIBSS|nr:GGDEF/FHA domain protein [Fibrobacter succinogenes subsp. succinogenes S85]